MIDIKNYITSFNSRLKFTANAIVEGFISGLHQSPYHGFSVEFSDHKAYSEGDPVSMIDWKLYSKTDRYYIKRFEEETNVRTVFLLDCSNSMAFTSQDIKKIDYARLLTACLIHLSLSQRDATGLTLFSDKTIATLPPKSKTIWLNQCLNLLSNIECEGQTDIASALMKCCDNIKKRSLIVVVTDCLDNSESLGKALNYLKFNKHHCILFHIVDPQEMMFNYKEESDFIDMETDEMIRLSPWKVKREYLAKREMFHVKHREMMQRLNFEYCLINTATPIETSLKMFLFNRNSRV